MENRDVFFDCNVSFGVAPNPALSYSRTAEALLVSALCKSSKTASTGRPRCSISEFECFMIGDISDIEKIYYVILHEN